jgi:hypothetical protein
METQARLTLATGEVTGTTRTWTATLLGGFHGGAYLIISDEDDYPIANGQSPLWRYGVDGKLVGRSDRTDAFTWYINPADAQRARQMRVFHTWAPDDFQTILDKWAVPAKKAGDILSEAAPIAMIFMGGAS